MNVERATLGRLVAETEFAMQRPTLEGGAGHGGGWMPVGAPDE